MKGVFFLLVGFCVSTCTSFEPLSIDREHMRFSQNRVLKMDGYYYSCYAEGYVTFFLFENGVFYDGGSLPDVTDLQVLDERKRENRKIAGARAVRYRWGIFKTEGSVITIERWLTGVGGPYPTQMLVGEIKNDTTIRFHTQIGDNSSFGNKKKTFEINETYYFRQFTPKPDSTSKFIN